MHSFATKPPEKLPLHTRRTVRKDRNLTLFLTLSRNPHCEDPWGGTGGGPPFKASDKNSRRTEREELLSSIKPPTCGLRRSIRDSRGNLPPLKTLLFLSEIPHPSTHRAKSGPQIPTPRAERKNCRRGSESGKFPPPLPKLAPIPKCILENCKKVSLPAYWGGGGLGNYSSRQS